eukprot:COSAG02_NODE_1153_length_14196_cov_3.626658_2_plen_176_part_00
MPTGRGFDTFFGYLGGMQDHFTQELGSMIKCRSVVDLTSDARPAHGDNGTYSGWMYNAKAVAVANEAPEPFFLNYWLQNTHAPFEVPLQYSDLYKFPGNKKLEVFNGMVSVVDEAVGNLTAALKARPGTWQVRFALLYGCSTLNVHCLLLFSHCVFPQLQPTTLRDNCRRTRILS